MFRKLFTISFLLALMASSLFAQQRAIIQSNGELVKLPYNKDLRESIKSSGLKTPSGAVAQNVFLPPVEFQSTGTLDTLSHWEGDPDDISPTIFGFQGQDVMFNWYEAPADLIIKAVGVAGGEGDIVEGVTNSLRIMKLKYTKEELAAYNTDVFIGAYHSPGGFLDHAALPEDATGEWYNLLGDPNYSDPPWAEDYDVWSDGGFGWPFTPEGLPAASGYQWIEMNNLGFEPEVKAGEVFAVVLINNGTDINADRVGYWQLVDRTGVYAWKYYSAGRSDVDGDGNPDPGWWVRPVAFNWVVAVDLIGDKTPTIESFDVLPTTLDNGPFDVTAVITDENPSGGAKGVASAVLNYTINGGDVQSITMTGTEPNFTATLPAGSPGDVYEYWIEATDVGGLTSTSTAVTFRIFKPEKTNALVIFNGFTSTTGYPPSYYWGDGSYVDPEAADPYATLEWDHDSWAYGPVTIELLNNYKNVIEITTNGPNDDNQAAILEWLNADGTRNYAAWGDEYLGGYYGWPSSPLTIPDGDFARDVLGVDVYKADALSPDGTLQTPISMVEGTILGDPLYQYFTQIQSDSGWTSPLVFDPISEGVTTSNWADGLDFVSEVTVFVKGTDPDGGEHALGGYRVLPGGNKIAFMAYDPLPVISSGDDPYWWYGFLPQSPQTQILDWFDALVVGVDEEVVPTQYSLGQNYPNPFNPSTKIVYSLPSKSNVTLKVYNLLGQEVATLFDGVKNAGSHTVSFDASRLSSGVYFYTITAGDFVSTKKMMLIK